MRPKLTRDKKSDPRHIIFKLLTTKAIKKKLKKKEKKDIMSQEQGISLLMMFY